MCPSGFPAERKFGKKAVFCFKKTCVIRFGRLYLLCVSKFPVAGVGPGVWEYGNKLTIFWKGLIMLKKFSLLLVAAVAAFSVQGAPWMSHNSRRAVKTLVVVGNYKTPRLMAATIKGLTSQPYLIIAGDGNYFAVLSKKTVKVPADTLDVYINSLNPRRVVIIGDERYVSREQENKLRAINLTRIPMMRIYGGDWGRIAEELDDLLNIGNLAREFRRNYTDLYMSDPMLKDPAAPAVPAAAPAAVAAPAAEKTADVPQDELPVSEPDQL